MIKCSSGIARLLNLASTSLPRHDFSFSFYFPFLPLFFFSLLLLLLAHCLSLFSIYSSLFSGSRPRLRRRSGGRDGRLHDTAWVVEEGPGVG